jgi:hypothetical protein
MIYLYIGGVYMYLNSRTIEVSPSFVFKPGHLLAIASLIENIVFAGCENPEVHLNCSLSKRSIGGSLSALNKLNPEEPIDSFSISFENGPFMYFTVEKSIAASDRVTASIAHPDLDQSLIMLEEFSRLFPVGVTKKQGTK